MAADKIGAAIETLIRNSKWKQAEDSIWKQLHKTPDDHWLWSRLSGVRYEQKDYKGALEAAEKALEIVSDCPLALWSKANAVEMLDRTGEAVELYLALFNGGLQQLKNPNEDANECWEGSDWTSGLMADCVFRIAGCFAKTGKRDEAIKWYTNFLTLGNWKVKGIYSRRDALERLNRLVPSKSAKREAAVKMMEKDLISA